MEREDYKIISYFIVAVVMGYLAMVRAILEHLGLDE